MYLYIFEEVAVLLFENSTAHRHLQEPTGSKPRTTTRTVSVTYHLWLPFLINRMLNLTTLMRVILGL